MKPVLHQRVQALSVHALCATGNSSTTTRPESRATLYACNFSWDFVRDGSRPELVMTWYNMIELHTYDHICILFVYIYIYTYKCISLFINISNILYNSSTFGGMNIHLPASLEFSSDPSALSQRARTNWWRPRVSERRWGYFQGICQENYRETPRFGRLIAWLSACFFLQNHPTSLTSHQVWRFSC